MRFLPSTLVIIVMGPLAGRLTDRIGPRPLMTRDVATPEAPQARAAAGEGELTLA